MVYLIGKKKELGRYPNERFLDGDPPKIRVEGPVTEEMERAIAPKHTHQYILGYRIEGKNVPTIWQWTSKRQVPDYYIPRGFPCISTRMKGVVEEFEPDVHQFFPVTVVNKAKEKIAERWLWVVCSRIDGVDREHTNLFFQNERLWTSSYKVEGHWKKVRNPKVVFNKSQTRGYHFWRDKHLMGGGIYASDEGAETVLALDLAGFSASKLETV
jgi:hypothetical protein